MKKTEEYSVSKHSAYVEFMTEQLKKTRPHKRPVSTEQCASTQAILNRPKDKDAEHWNRPVLKEWMVKQEERPIPVDQMLAYRKMQQSVKNTLGDASDASLQEDSKQRAISAFTCSPPAELNQLEQQKVTKMEPYSELPMTAQPKPKKRYFYWLYEHYAATFFVMLIAAAIAFLRITL